jgi:hypothetical protein
VKEVAMRLSGRRNRSFNNVVCPCQGDDAILGFVVTPPDVVERVLKAPLVCLTMFRSVELGQGQLLQTSCYSLNFSIKGIVSKNQLILDICPISLLNRAVDLRGRERIGFKQFQQAYKGDEEALAKCASLLNLFLKLVQIGRLQRSDVLVDVVFFRFDLAVGRD